MFVIAEAGVNHNGDPSLAHQMIEVAKEAGADAIKFQTFDVDRLLTRSAPRAAYQVENTKSTDSQYDMLAGLQLTNAAHESLKTACERNDLVFLSSPFDEHSVDFLVSLGVSALKIPSGELTNLPYLAHAAAQSLPLIVSTGMATMAEVGDAVETIRANGNHSFALLHCLSNYPADPAEANLRAMSTMAEAFDVVVGYSDHTPGIAVAPAAVALGASVIEKHFTLDRMLPGPDHKASLEPEELRAMIDSIRTVESALGDGIKRPQPSEVPTAAVARKSIVAKQGITAGTVLRREMLTVMRPGTGLPPSHLEGILGRRLCRDVAQDSVLMSADIEPAQS